MKGLLLLAVIAVLAGGCESGTKFQGSATTKYGRFSYDNKQILEEGPKR